MEMWKRLQGSAQELAQHVYKMAASLVAGNQEVSQTHLFICGVVLSSRALLVPACIAVMVFSI